MFAENCGILLTWFLALCAGGGAAAQGSVSNVVRGRVIPVGGGEVRAVRVFVRAGEMEDSVAVDSAGGFALGVPAEFADSVDLWVDGGDLSEPGFHPARPWLGREDVSREQEIVLVPFRWTIQTGRFAGRAVDVSLIDALMPPCAGCTGFFRALEGKGDSGRTALQGWPAERFPLRVAFDREWSGERISARDSVAFWREATELEAALGGDVFRPANYADAVPRQEGGPDDVILVWFDPEMRGLGGIGTAVSNGENIGYGDLRLNRHALHEEVSAPGLVSHELMHTLGFGHTCAWRSVVADVRRCPFMRAPAATEEDVAYAELAAAVRALLHGHPRRWALEAALAAMHLPGPRPPVAATP